MNMISPLVSKCIRCGDVYGCLHDDKKTYCKECSGFPCTVCVTDISGGICFRCLLEKFSMISVKKGVCFGV